MKQVKFIITTLIFILVFPGVSAAQQDTNLVDPEEIKELHSQVLNLVINNEEEKIESLSLYKKYNDIFENSPELEEQYFENLDSKKRDESKITEEFVTSNSQQVKVYEDGSFAIITNTLTTDEGTLVEEEPSISTYGVVQDTGEQTYTGSIGQAFTNNARHDIWGAYKVAEAHLVTNYTISSGSAKITNTKITGTKAWFPGVIQGSSRVVTNNARITESIGEYQYSGTCPAGWGTCATTYMDITTKINIKYAGNGKITFTVRSIVTT